MSPFGPLLAAPVSCTGPALPGHSTAELQLLLVVPGCVANQAEQLSAESVLSWHTSLYMLLAHMLPSWPFTVAYTLAAAYVHPAPSFAIWAAPVVRCAVLCSAAAIPDSHKSILTAEIRRLDGKVYSISPNKGLIETPRGQGGPTHFAAQEDKLKWTLNLLVALVRGLPVINAGGAGKKCPWLQDCM